jgi:hypothetical protein
MSFIVSTLPTSQLDRFPAKLLPANISSIVITLLTSHALMSGLQEPLSLNNAFMLVTSVVFHSEMSPYKSAASASELTVFGPGSSKLTFPPQ